MALDSSQIVFRAPLNRVQGDTNGGRMSVIQIISNTPENVFTNVFSAQRANGLTDYQWVFILAAGESRETLMAGYQYIFNQPGSETYVCFFVGNQRSTAGDYGLPSTDTERKYAPAVLKNSASAGATTLTLTAKNAAHTTGADNCWKDGDHFFISDKPQFDSLSGNTEWMIIDGIPVIDANGLDVTINITTALTNNFTAGSVISTYPDKADVLGNNFDNYDDAGISGSTSVDISTEGNLTVDSIGALEFTLTFTITGENTFDVTTDYPGIPTLPAGNTTIDYAPENGAWSRAYFTLKAGSITNGQAGDYFRLQIHPPAIAIVQKRVIPAGAASAQGDNITLVGGGES